MKFLSVFPAYPGFKAVLIIYVVLPLIAGLGIFGYFWLSSMENQIEKKMQKDLELVARAVQLPLSYALEKERMGSIEQSLESVFAIGRVYSAYVYNNQGKELVRLGQTEPDPSRDKLSELAAEGERQGEYSSVAGREVFSYFVPLNDSGGRIIGLLHLTRKKSEFSDSLKSLRIKGLLSLAGLLVILSTVVLYGHHRALGVHLGRLVSSMSKIASGDRAHRFDVRGPREIVRIGESFNYMLNSIDKAEQTILEHRMNQQKLERELRHAEKLAAIGRLAAGTAHELGSPLSVIKGRAQRGLRNKNSENDYISVLTSIRAEVERMEHIIRQLLDFSRQSSLRCAPATPFQLAESVVSAVEDEAKKNGSLLKIEGNQDQKQIFVDNVRVQQALINLLNNAVQSDSGVSVRLSWERFENGVVFTVDDDGPGILPEEYNRIFEPFYTTKEVGKGTGLGLSVVYTVAEEHGGFVEVGTSDMGGASFRFFVRSQESNKNGGNI
ncbi:MAG: ATP-binding protein [Thermodesulfobacteriota bacterium]